jgi:hypothetical protein
MPGLPHLDTYSSSCEKWVHLWSTLVVYMDYIYVDELRGKSSLPSKKHVHDTDVAVQIRGRDK